MRQRTPRISPPLLLLGVAVAAACIPPCRAQDAADASPASAPGAPADADPARAADRSWPGFRGVGDGHADVRLGGAWGEDRIAWTVDLPGYGQSSPVVGRGRVHVASVVGPRKETGVLTCVDAERGEVVWTFEHPTSVPSEATEMVSRAAPTPALGADGRVFAFFENGDLVAVGPDGKLLWHRDLHAAYGPFEGNHGLGSSPLVAAGTGAAGGVLLLPIEHSGRAVMLALDPDDGSTRWSAERTPRISWTTPVVVPAGTAGSDRDRVLFSSNGTVDLYDLETGEPLASVEGLEGNTLQSVVRSGDLALAAASKAGRTVMLRIDGERLRVVWKGRDARPDGFASPVFAAGLALLTNKAGVVTALDPRTGERAWRQRTASGCWASPITDGRLVAYFGETGRVTVLRPGLDGAEVVAEGGWTPTGGRVYGVAAAAGRVFAREGRRLVCFRGVGDREGKRALRAGEEPVGDRGGATR